MIFLDGASLTLEQVVPDPAERAPLVGRSMVVRKLRALPVEAVVRGYLIGTGWKDYSATGAICGITLPRGLTAMLSGLFSVTAAGDSYTIVSVSARGSYFHT